ncbi:MAG TPA: peptidoglycan-binding protein [Motilibacterales bacterium]|nr:peptidoglycan-binding protein [Motilibacterales bacterium]
MKKALGCSLLSAALVSGLGLPAQAVGPPGADPAEGSTPGQVTALAKTVTPAAAARLRPALRLGSRSPAVVYVQATLGVKPASGYYGPLTARAVKAAQKRHGLKATGRVTARTWKVLLSATSSTTPASDPAPTESPAAPVATPPTPEQAALTKPALAPGSRGPAVMFVQEKLGISPATGYYGTLTRAAVSALQGAHNLEATGKVGSATWKILLAAEGVIEVPLDAGTRTPAAPAPTETDPAATPAQPAAPAPPTVTPEQAAAARPLLSPGAGPGDPAVVFVQKHLRVSPSTGYFGKLTTGAVKAYQAGLGIVVTGTVDAPTWDALLGGRTVAPTPAAAPATPAAATIPTPTYTLPANPTAADRAVVFALAQVGKPYVLGGNGPEVFDCSGLIQQAYLTSGVTLPRLASQQRFAGTTVSIDQLAPGDLLYYQDGSSPRKGHISMFAGNGLVVEAANTRRGVRIRTLHERWYRDRFVAAVRIG